MDRGIIENDKVKDILFEVPLMTAVKKETRSFLMSRKFFVCL